MLRRLIFVLFIFCISPQFFSQQSFYQIIEEKDTTEYALKYYALDSLEKGELLAYFEDNPIQIAIHKKYFLGKQSGVTRTYFPNGAIYEVIVYQKGKKEGDYSRYNSLGELVIKAQYRDGIKWGFYIDRKERIQGRYRNAKKHGKWEYNVGSPEYGKKFFREGKLVEKRQVFADLKSKLFQPKQKPKRDDEIKGREDSLLIPFGGDTSWYSLDYVARDLLPHPAMRKAYFSINPKILAHTKYVYNGYVNGMYKIYYPNGKLYLFSNYTAGFLDGKWKQYDENGTLRIKGNYLDGLKVGKWEYNLGTEKYHKEKYRSGVLKE
ncbi:MAG: hypothetical protein JKY48_09760 [Flavobacteriales bacterium]|nr:hypothetical protein [Flavobacteriales bacterium]